MKEKIYAAISAAIASATTVFSPLLYLLFAMSMFLFMDFFAAVAASLKQKDGFSWSRLWDSIPKAMIYCVAITAAYYTEVNWLPGTKLGHLTCAALCWRELKSINKHSKTVTGYDVLGTVINALKKK